MTRPDSNSLNQEATEVAFFKLRPVNKYTIDSLIKKQLYFSSPAELNDPYDCQADIAKSIQSAIKKTSGKQKAQLEQLPKQDRVLKTLSSMLVRSGVFSGSEKLLNPVMWSHYADGHRGIGLCYKIPTSFILNKGMGMAPVDYGDSLLAEWFETCAISFDTDFFFEVMKKEFTVKGLLWEYENEIRLVRSECGGVDFDPVFLKEVSFGLRTPEGDKELIRNIVGTNYPQCGLVQIERGNNDFDIKAIDL